MPLKDPVFRRGQSQLCAAPGWGAHVLGPLPAGSRRSRWAWIFTFELACFVRTMVEVSLLCPTPEGCSGRGAGEGTLTYQYVTPFHPSLGFKTQPWGHQELLKGTRYNELALIVGSLCSFASHPSCPSPLFAPSFSSLYISVSA